MSEDVGVSAARLDKWIELVELGGPRLWVACGGIGNRENRRGRQRYVFVGRVTCLGRFYQTGLLDFVFVDYAFFHY